jgi:hypothetical protein
MLTGELRNLLIDLILALLDLVRRRGPFFDLGADLTGRTISAGEAAARSARVALLLQGG